MKDFNSVYRITKDVQETSWDNLHLSLQLHNDSHLLRAPHTIQLEQQ